MLIVQAKFNMKQIFLLVLVFCNTAVEAQIFKCKNTAGKITYSESTCPKNMSGGEIIIEDNVIDSSYLRGKVKSQKMQELNSSTNQTTVTRQTLNNKSIIYMNSYDIDTRLNQLKVQMSDQTYYEKIADAENEIGKLKNRKPRSLSHDLEQKRSNLKVDLTHRDPLKRQSALSDLSDLYLNY